MPIYNMSLLYAIVQHAKEIYIFCQSVYLLEMIQIIKIIKHLFSTNKHTFYFDQVFINLGESEIVKVI